MSYYFSPLRLIAGVVFILAGVFAYYGFRTIFALPVVLIVAGGALVLVVLTKHRPGGGDIALLVFALLVFGVVTSGPISTLPQETVTYSASRSQVNVNQVALKADASFGGVRILFSDNESLAYRVEFSRSTAFPFFRGNEPGFSFSNQTKGGTLMLNVSSTDAEIYVILGPHYTTSIDASTGTGSISLTAPRTERIENVVLKTGTGSINANMAAQGIKLLSLSAGTGSVHLKSGYLAASGTDVPFAVSTGTGSVSVDVNIPRSTSAALTATTDLGTVSHSLQGFTIAHSSNNRLDATTEDTTRQENSFRIRISTGTGSIDLKAARLAQTQL
ncbi:MAG: DUF4097 domain-containing protein [Thaumarchaeota archaeon]|nr:DUF4097 domain-containing protein [Nitrososphaerota archaeon]MCL5318395.1 DUF4097 domain-containing protein [Nitrososphaerota archaeon]